MRFRTLPIPLGLLLAAGIIACSPATGIPDSRERQHPPDNAPKTGEGTMNVTIGHLIAGEEVSPAEFVSLLNSLVLSGETRTYEEEGVSRTYQGGEHPRTGRRYELARYELPDGRMLQALIDAKGGSEYFIRCEPVGQERFRRFKDSLEDWEEESHADLEPDPEEEDSGGSEETWRAVNPVSQEVYLYHHLSTPHRSVESLRLQRQ